jgi:hypothetical protein
MGSSHDTLLMTSASKGLGGDTSLFASASKLGYELDDAKP